MILLNHSTPAQEPKIRVTAPINNSRFMVGVLGLFFCFFCFAFFGLRDSLLLIGINTTPGRRHASLSCCVRKDFGGKISNGFAVANFVNKESTESIDKVLKRKVEVFYDALYKTTWSQSKSAIVWWKQVFTCSTGGSCFVFLMSFFSACFCQWVQSSRICCGRFLTEWRDLNWMTVLKRTA